MHAEQHLLETVLTRRIPYIVVSLKEFSLKIINFLQKRKKEKKRTWNMQ